MIGSGKPKTEKTACAFGILLCLSVLLALTGCGTGKVPASDKAAGKTPATEGSVLQEDGAGMTAGSDTPKDGVSVSGRPGTADSLDDAIILKTDEDNGRILFYSRNAKKTYFLDYDSSTTIRDAYDRELVAGQLLPGDIVKTAFLKDKHFAKGIWSEPEMTRNDGVENFELHINASLLETGGQTYAIAKDCLVISRGKVLTLSDINENDILSLTGKDKEILAITITRGHGYVRLEGADAFEGGFLEFGQSIIRKVEKDALYAVPEGSYQMLISKGKDSGVKQIDVKPDEEIVVDVSDIITDADRSGKIVFTITPPGARLLIDENETDYSAQVELSYGIHQVVVSADGYKTLTQYIKVGEPAANLSIELQKGEEKSAGEDENSAGKQDVSVSGNSPSVVSPRSSDRHMVYIDGPAQAELYVDDAYVGIVPASFVKTAGKHTISLRRQGYVSRSYTLDIDSGDNDNHYSFSSLKPSGTGDETDLSTAALSNLVTNALSGLGG